MMAGAETSRRTNRRPRSRRAAPAVLDGSKLGNDLYEAALDALDSHVAVLDAGGKIIHVNEQWRRFSTRFGDGRDHVGENYVEVCERAGEPHAQDVAGQLREVLAGEREEVRFEYPCHDASARRWFVMRARRLGSGHALVVHDEVSERRATEERSALHAALVDEVDASIVVTDLTRSILTWNSGAEELYGWTRADALGRDMAELVTPEDPTVVEEARTGVTSEGRWDGSFFFVRPDGTRRAVYSRMRVVADGDGAPRVFVVVSVDVTEREQRVQAELERLAWVTRVQAALAEDRFVLHAQPIIDLASGEVVQRELLLRMRPPDDWDDQSLIAPSTFLAAAEQHGLIGDIDRWVIERAAALAAAGISVELNVSGPSVSDPTLPEHIAGALTRTGADPRMLTFEITETTLVSDEEAARAFVERMHALGCRIALDDFGTGYGTFTYLKQLPIDYLKIDIEFVRDLVDEPASRNVVEAIVSLARSFGLSTVAEGVEDEKTIELLRALGVDYAQGFHVGRPLPFQPGPARSGARIPRRRAPRTA
jgi:PAS domain S-box-containing protein